MKVSARDPGAVAVVVSALIFEVERDARARGETDSVLADWRRRMDRVVLVGARRRVKIRRYCGPARVFLSDPNEPRPKPMRAPGWRTKFGERSKRLARTIFWRIMGIVASSSRPGRRGCGDGWLQKATQPSATRFSRIMRSSSRSFFPEEELCRVAAVSVRKGLFRFAKMKLRHLVLIVAFRGRVLVSDDPSALAFA